MTTESSRLSRLKTREEAIKLAIEDQIMAAYHHLLMLDNDTDKEKRWIEARQPKAAGLSTLHFHILSYIEAHPNTTAKQISDQLNVLPGTLSKKLTVLVRRQLVTHYPDDQDARSKHYQLTGSGQQIARVQNQLLQLKNDLLKQHLSRFSKTDLQTIETFLRVMNDAEEHDSYDTVDHHKN